MKDRAATLMELRLTKRRLLDIDEAGMAIVMGSNKSFFLKTDAAKTPETFEVNKPATWNRDGKAIQVTAISAAVGTNKFNMNTFEPDNTSGPEKSWWSVVLE